MQSQIEEKEQQFNQQLQELIGNLKSMIYSEKNTFFLLIR